MENVIFSNIEQLAKAAIRDYPNTGVSESPGLVLIASWITLGPAYNEFDYNEHSAITSNFSLRKKITSDWHQY